MEETTTPVPRTATDMGDTNDSFDCPDCSCSANAQQLSASACVRADVETGLVFVLVAALVHGTRMIARATGHAGFSRGSPPVADGHVANRHQGSQDERGEAAARRATRE